MPYRFENAKKDRLGGEKLRVNCLLNLPGKGAKLLLYKVNSNPDDLEDIFFSNCRILSWGLVSYNTDTGYLKKLHHKTSSWLT